MLSHSVREFGGDGKTVDESPRFSKKDGSNRFIKTEIATLCNILKDEFKSIKNEIKFYDKSNEIDVESLFAECELTLNEIKLLLNNEKKYMDDIDIDNKVKGIRSNELSDILDLIESETQATPPTRDIAKEITKKQKQMKQQMFQSAPKIGPNLGTRSISNKARKLSPVKSRCFFRNKRKCLQLIIKFHLQNKLHSTYIV